MRAGHHREARLGLSAELPMALRAVQLDRLPLPQLLNSLLVLITRPLIFARLAKVVKFLTKPVFLVAHDSSGPLRPWQSVHVLDQFPAARLFDRLIEFRAQIDSHIFGTLLRPQPYVTRISVE